MQASVVRRSSNWTLLNWFQTPDQIRTLQPIFQYLTTWPPCLGKFTYVPLLFTHWVLTKWLIFYMLTVRNSMILFFFQSPHIMHFYILKNSIHHIPYKLWTPAISSVCSWKFGSKPWYVGAMRACGLLEWSNPRACPNSCAATIIKLKPS